MGLTAQSSGISLLRESFNIQSKTNPVIALAGNPNTGKSTVFNGLTGLKQHTGNWPGKTVAQAQGYYNYLAQEYTVIDLPGTYSLLANSKEEQIARNFICFAQPDATVVITDATNLERNLNLVLQVTELTDRVILCLNLMDEAKRQNIKIDKTGLANDLGVPVVPTVARDGRGLRDLKETIRSVINHEIKLNPVTVKYGAQIESLVEDIVLRLKEEYPNLGSEINLRWLALRLLEGDKTIMKRVDKIYTELSLQREVRQDE